MKTRKSYKKIIGDYAFQSYETQARANEQATDFVAEALTGSYVPHVITYRGNIAIMSREPSGWVYSIIASRSNSEQLYAIIEDVSKLHGNHNPKSFEDCQRCMLNHLAQNAYIVGDIEVPSYIFSASDRSDIESWYRWQNRIAEARSMGMSDDECRKYADAA